MNELKSVLDNRNDLQKYLFCRGFLLTNRDLDTEPYPFYGNWNRTDLGYGYKAYIHNLQRSATFRTENESFILIGNAYNPYTMEYEEKDILQHLSTVSDRIDYINELTGVFLLGIIRKDSIQLHVDASAQQWACYGFIKGHLYVSSHMRLIGDLLNLQMTDYSQRLINYRWYHYMMGAYLPGDITCFSELTRIVPNTYVEFSGESFSVIRFYPNKPIEMCKNSQEYKEVIKEGTRILRNTLALIPKKWPHPAISLTGGIDSNTTFAAANGNYDKYTTFSYVSMYRESVDAEKAQEISEHFNVPWKRYDVPENNEDFPDFDIWKKLLEWNDGGIGSNSDSDIRKKITLIQNDVCDVEVKSWISETIRAYAYKYFGRTSFPKNLSARNYTSLYKIFFMNRRLVHETDEHFRQYWANTQLKSHLFNYDESDFFVWEMMHGYKCGLNIGAMKTCFDITIPYNNRKLLDTLLRVPLKRRLNDQLHLDLKRVLNKELYDMNIRVVNLNETERRKKMANIYFTVNSKLPF